MNIKKKLRFKTELSIERITARMGPKKTSSFTTGLSKLSRTKLRQPKRNIESVHFAVDDWSDPYPTLHVKELTPNYVTKPITNLRFTFMTDDEIENYAACECTEHTNKGKNSVYDSRLGVKHSNEICENCKEDWKTCPGHFGYIKFVHRIPHPLKTKTILQYLSLFCSNPTCCRLVISEEHIHLHGLHSLKGQQRFERLVQEVDEKFTVCSHCGTLNLKYAFEDDKFVRKHKKEKWFVSFQEIETIFSNIRDWDVVQIGLDPKYVHPMMLLIKNFLVLPPCSRSFVTKGDGTLQHDDLTGKYNEIIKINNKLKRSDLTENQQQAELSGLVTQVLMLMDYSKVKNKSTSSSERHGLRCLKKRLNGKTGQVRANVMGKRIDFCARTVITPEAMGALDQLVIPVDIAKKLTLPVKVTKENIEECRQMIREDKVNIVFRPNKEKPGQEDDKFHPKLHGQAIQFQVLDTDLVLRNGVIINPNQYEALKKKPLQLEPGDQILRDGQTITPMNIKTDREYFEIEVGDTIERQVKDGDWTLFNRQPTLWKGSMRGKQIRVLPGKTFRFNLASTAAYNADFDGDEMNLFLAQSYSTIAECKEIVSTKANFISPQDSKPMISIKQDGMSGAFVLTKGYVPIAKDVFMDCLSMPHFSIEWILEKTYHIRQVLEAYRYIERENEDEFDNLYYTGHILFSFLLPNDFEYYCDNTNEIKIGSKPVLIRQGVLLEGTLDKTSLGSSSGSMIHHLWKDYGATRASAFVSQFQILINCWLQHHGLSIGLEDCIPEQLESVQAVVNKCFLEAAAIIQTEKNDVVLEAKVSYALNQAVTKGQKIANDALRSDNTLVNVVTSGSKGNFVNVAQVTGLVGQQNVSAERIKKLYGGRTLPHFRFDDHLQDPTDIKELSTLFLSRGFVKSSFFEGLNVCEFFMHAAGGREGLIDTAVKTGKSISFNLIFFFIYLLFFFFLFTHLLIYSSGYWLHST